MSPMLPCLDLLRERRLELGLPAEPPRPPDARRLVLIGSAIGTGLVICALGATLLLKLEAMLLERELARLAPVRGQVETLEAELAADEGNLERKSKGNAELVTGLVAVRSGSALMTDLAGRTPAELQLTSVQVGKDDLQLKGRTSDPGAFERINALVLRLKGSPLINPASVNLNRAIRNDTDPNKSSRAPESGFVEFEVSAAFSPSPSGLAQLTQLQELGAGGMARRLELLQKEGLLQ